MLFLDEISVKDKLDDRFNQQYFSSLACVKSLMKSPLKFQKSITIFSGENGSGKSTILEAIAVGLGFNPEGGSKNLNFSTNNNFSSLYNYLSFCRGIKREKTGYFLRAESFYNVASEIEKLDEYPCGAPFIMDSYGGKSIHARSHGEGFMALFENRFSDKGLYILDEPEAALSPAKQLELIKKIISLSSSQFIIATHSPILLAIPHAQILQISDDGIFDVKLTQTENYKLYKSFLDNPERFLHYYL